MGTAPEKDTAVGRCATVASGGLRDAASEAMAAQGTRTEPVAPCASCSESADRPSGLMRSVVLELAYNAGRARGALVFDLAVLAFCCAGFYGNEHGLKTFAVAAFPGSPATYLVQCHLNDFLGGAAFLAYTNLLFDLVRPDMRIRRLATSLVYLFFCGLFWEYAAPLFIKASTADPLDLVAYLAGAFVYWLVGRPLRRLLRGHSVERATG